MRVNLDNLGFDDFIAITPKAQVMKEKKQTNQTISELKTFVHQRTLSRQRKIIHPQNGRKILQIYRVYFKNTYNSIASTQLKNGQRT